jgi:hypothetical protein
MRVLLLTATTLALVPCLAQQNDDKTWLQFIGLELRQLRVELLERRLAEETDRIAGLERELAALRLDQNQHSSEERIHRQQIADLERQAEDPGVDSEARAQMQTLKAELSTGAVERDRLARAALTAREADATERLRLARGRLQAFADRLKLLTAPAR